MSSTCFDCKERFAPDSMYLIKAPTLNGRALICNPFTEAARLDEEVTDARDDVIELGGHAGRRIAFGDGSVTVFLLWVLATRIDWLTERIEELEARA